MPGADVAPRVRPPYGADRTQRQVVVFRMLRYTHCGALAGAQEIAQARTELRADRPPPGAASTMKKP
jgi:hypothetical protein